MFGIVEIVLIVLSVLFSVYIAFLGWLDWQVEKSRPSWREEIPSDLLPLELLERNDEQDVQSSPVRPILPMVEKLKGE